MRSRPSVVTAVSQRVLPGLELVAQIQPFDEFAIDCGRWIVFARARVLYPVNQRVRDVYCTCDAESLGFAARLCAGEATRRWWSPAAAHTHRAKCSRAHSDQSLSKGARRQWLGEELVRNGGGPEGCVMLAVAGLDDSTSPYSSMQMGSGVLRGAGSSRRNGAHRLNQMVFEV